MYYYKHIFLSTTVPILYHTSLLTGDAWVCKLMNGHPDQIRHNLGVSLEVFEVLAYTRTALQCHTMELCLRNS
ncbi:hypothetical protein SERLA73DRAFT_44365 [Serpula lacrymans var. lacrymans S7.3]|uniref:Uncharacterized protein n=1 Tax=Serpula lacrymans var. lacrymans (strain S7.3) TaxID=936435 RepID=F8PFR3_SERL3|nr:hypothetical protein SERLA73DRAFT_44365 [Serpula lacrymans var. lacrymans S7.3]